MSSLEISFQELEELVASRPCIAYVSAGIVTETTPLAAYSAMIDGVENSYSFLLESGEKDAHSASKGGQKSNRINEHAQYSFIGYDPEAIVTVGHKGAEISVLKESPMADQISIGRGDVLGILEGVAPKYPLVGFP